MLLLGNVSSKIQVVTSAAVALDVHASLMDVVSGSAPTSSTQNTVIVTATTTDVVSAPTGSNTRNVKELVLRARGGANTVTIKHTDGTTAPEICKFAMNLDDTLVLGDTGKITLYDSTGAVKVTTAASGLLIKTTVLTAGTSFTTDARTRSMRLRMVGGGGGGAGCTSVASAASAGGGGGAGGYVEKTSPVSGNTAYTYAIGGAGAGASGALGGSGGNTTFTIGGTTYNANGGTGAPVATAVTTLSAYVGGAGGTASNGDSNVAGEPGSLGVIVAVTPLGCSGKGGCSPFGGGGNGVSAAGNGVTATGFGGGGGGALTGASAVRTGGSGTAGMIIVDEYT